MRRIVFTLLFLLSCAFGLAQTPTVQSDTKVKGTFEVTGAVKFDGSVCINTNCITIWPTGSGGITQLTGDGLVGPGSGSQALTLATVNSSPGTCGDTTHVCQVTTNNKGLVTAQSAVSITGGGGGTISGQVVNTIPLNTNGTSTAINAASALSQTGIGTGSTVTAAGNSAANQFTINYPAGTPSAIPVSIADDSRFSGLASRRMTTFTLNSYNQSHAYTSGHMLGDSIMRGFSSGGTGAENCDLPFTSANTCFAALVTQALGISGSAVTSEAVAGDATPDLMYREFNSFTGPADSMYSMIEIGTNDMQGVQRNISPASLAIEPDLIQQWMALEEYYSIDPANWYEATGSTCSGGSWTADTYYGTHPGCQSHTTNDVLTFPAWQSVTGGEPVTVLYRVFNPAVANGATFFVKIGVGSSSSGPFTPTASATFNTVSTAAPLNFINITGANATSTIFPAVLSNSTNVLGPGTGTSNSAFIPVAGSWYQVTVTIISATSSANNLSIIGMGTGMGFECATCNTNPFTWPSQFWRLSIPATKGAYQWGIWHQLNGDWDTATLLDQQSGFSVNKLDTSTSLTNDPSLFDPANIHHPIANGHADIAAAVLFGKPSKSVPPTSSASASVANISGGTIVGTVNLGTTGAAMQFNDQTGELVFAPRSGNITTGSLLTFDARSAPTFPPTSTNTAALPGIAGNGHWLDQIMAWYDSVSTNVYAQAWRDIYGSNTSATVTPTRFTRTFSCVPTAVAGFPTVGACQPLDWVLNFPNTSTLSFTGVRNTFTGNSVLSGLNVGCISSDPSTLVNGDIWCNSTSNRIKWRLNGVTQTGASLSDISGMTAASEVIPLVAFNSTAGTAIPNGSTEMYSYNFPTAINLGHLGVRIITADNTGTNLYDIGVYSLGFGTGTSGSLLAHTGPIAGTTFAPATGFVSEAMTSSVLLAPGTYLIAVTSNCASSCAALAASSNTIGISRFGSTGSGTGGTLPSTITPASFSPNFSSNIWGMTAFQ